MKFKAFAYFLTTLSAGCLTLASAETSATNTAAAQQLTAIKKSEKIKLPDQQPLQPIAQTSLADGYNACGDTVIITHLDWETSSLPSGWHTFDNNGGQNGMFTWGRTNCDAWGGNYAGWCAAGGANALDPCSNDYPDSCASWLEYNVAMDLSDAASAGASFKYRLVTEGGVDFLWWGISIDGINYKLRGFSGDHNWHEMDIDFFNDYSILADEASRDRVYFTIIFESNGANSSGAGAFIDDLMIYKVSREYTPPQDVALKQENDLVNMTWSQPLGIEKRNQIATDDDMWERITTIRNPHAVFAKGPFELPQYPATVKSACVAFYIESGENAFQESIRVNVYVDTNGVATKPSSNLLVVQSEPLMVANTGFVQHVDLSRLNIVIPKGVFFIGIEQLGSKLAILRDISDSNANSFEDTNGDGIFEQLNIEDGTFGIRVVYATYGSLHELTNYDIYRSQISPIDIIADNRIARLPTNLTNCADENVLPGDTYYYLMTAAYGDVQSCPSDELAITVALPPIIELSPTSLEAQAMANQPTIISNDLTLKNAGAGVLNWTSSISTSGGGSWLSLTPSYGLVDAAQTQTLTVSINPQQLAKGNYSGSITFDSADAENSPQTVAVQVTVINPPIIGTSPQEVPIESNLDEGDTTPIPVTLTNRGDAELNWALATETENEMAWIIVSAAEGTLSGGASAQFTVGATPTPGIQKGVHKGKIIITDSLATNSPYEIAVTWDLRELEPAQLYVSPQYLHFESYFDAGNTAPLSITLSNQGQKDLNWVATATSESGLQWILVDTLSGTLKADQSTQITAQAALVQGLAKGIHRGKISVSDSLAANSPQEITVTWDLKDNNPPVITFIGSGLPVYQTPFSVSATVLDEDGVVSDSTRLYYKKWRSGEFQAANMSGNGDTFTGSIPGDVISPEGFCYYVNACDVFGNKCASDTLASGIHLPAGANNSQIDIQGGTEQNIYRMISFPGILSQNTITDVLKVFGKRDSCEWRVFHYARGGYYEYTDAGDFQPGKAFWIISRQAKTITFGESQTLNPGEFFEIVLAPGWNQIADPFYFNVSWDAVLNESNTENVDAWLYQYDKEYRQADQMIPFEGYFVKNYAASNISLKLNPQAIAGLHKPVTIADEFKQADLLVHIKGQYGAFSDELNYLGIHKNALPEKDSFDHAEPPPLMDGLAIYFPHEDWKSFSGWYTTDVHPVAASNHTWEFVVDAGAAHALVSLEFEILHNNLSHNDLILLDLATGRPQNLLNKAQYAYNCGSDSQRRFRVAFGDGEFIQSTLNAFIPARFTVLQNYPNPFNSQTSLQFGVHNTCVVKATIFDNLGRVIKVLTNRVYEPGVYTLHWDGINEENRLISSGVYFCRIETDKESEVIKLLFVK